MNEVNDTVANVSITKILLAYIGLMVSVFAAGYLVSNYPAVGIPLVAVAVIIIRNFCRVCPRLKGSCPLCSA